MAFDSIDIRVYYEDTDCGGVVYHSQYLNFFERGRTEWLRALGYMQSSLVKDDVIFAVSRADTRFKQPARFDDLLQVKTKLVKLGRASMGFNQQLVKGDTVMCEAHVTVGCLSGQSFKPKKIPQDMYQTLQAHLSA